MDGNHEWCAHYSSRKCRVGTFILADKNLRYQQNLAGRKLALLELWTNHRPTLAKHFPRIRTAAESVQPGDYVALEAP